LNIKFTTKPNILLLVLSVLLFIMTFVSWYTFNFGYGFSASQNGFHSGGYLTFIMSLVGIALSFLEIPTPRYKSLGIIGVGILALLGVIIAMTDLGSGIGMGFGMILALIISILIMALGFFDLRGVDVLARFKASQTKSTPPPPPPPPPPASPPPPPPSNPPPAQP
jgi:hypothetical protein